jgi:exonuclease SbcC
VRLTRLYLRNYRVYEEPLELEVPPGLVGVYGPNGAGKSTLLEAILFSLWGKARTGKEDVRTAGVGGDCVAEVEFEHEGHLYLVRRTLSGINSTAKAEAHCDNLMMAEGVRDTGRYVHQVLGMDDAAFRASVFAEQKQLASFSNQTPAERRRLVLQLLGITPLDAARDSVRKDARTAREQHDKLRGLLPDLDVLRVEAEDGLAKAAALVTVAEGEEQSAATLTERARTAEAALASLDQARQEYDGLVLEGKAARAELNSAVAAVQQLQSEQAALESAAVELASVAPLADGLDAVEHELRLVDAVAAAVSHRVDLGEAPPVPDEVALESAGAAAVAAAGACAAVRGQRQAVEAELARAREQAKLSATLSGEAECPMCGQALGDAFEQVQSHRAAEVEAASSRLAELERDGRRLDKGAKAAAAAAEAETAAHRAAQKARAAWEQASARQADATRAAAHAFAALVAAVPRWDNGGAVPGQVDGGGAALPDSRLLSVEVEQLQADRRRRREAAATAQRLRGRLERQPALANLLDRAQDKVGDAEARVQTLLDKVKGLAFDTDQLAAARSRWQEATQAAERASRSAQTARLEAERERTRAEARTQRLADGEAQHAKLAELSAEATHLSRTAELLNSFRNTVVAAVGPRLAVQAASLFGELTDNEYDQLEVDPETYELQVRDAGRIYGMDRFSGSEIDLANLALRVAISEHVRFQSGGSVGLLVLDEVFGPLDEDRKARMLMALERLRGRFRQILVVTHDTDIKEQLPSAIEVVKKPGRRATARLMEAS